MADATEREQRTKTVLMAKAANERRPDDVTGAAALVYDDVPRHIARALGGLGIPYAAWGGLGRAELSSIVSDTPVLDIERRLRVGRLESGDYSITGNDLYDMQRWVWQSHRATWWRRRAVHGTCCLAAVCRAAIGATQ